ncbi:MAG: hypothetical protein HQK50_05835 [Oligoflexia bacterium]|nr:hypothetical protein [Oligoflexia bacterium]MBF0365071.1 hypothetical protein [Oligoflexia bacterium]
MKRVLKWREWKCTIEVDARKIMIFSLSMILSNFVFIKLLKDNKEGKSLGCINSIIKNDEQSKQEDGDEFEIQWPQ